MGAARFDIVAGVSWLLPGHMSSPFEVSTKALPFGAGGVSPRRPPARPLTSPAMRRCWRLPRGATGSPESGPGRHFDVPPALAAQPLELLPFVSVAAAADQLSVGIVDRPWLGAFAAGDSNPLVG